MRNDQNPQNNPPSNLVSKSPASGDELAFSWSKASLKKKPSGGGGGIIGKVLSKPLFWVVFVILSFAIPIVRSLQQPKLETLPVLSKLSDFELTNQNQQKVKLSDLRGSVLVVNFIFTSCADVCPVLTRQMMKLQSRLMGIGPAIKLVSISVDPDHDTPQVLKKYGESFHADFKIWQFLTGPYSTVAKIVGDGFKVGMSKESPDPMDIVHGRHFAIVDQLGQMRAYKLADNDKDLNEIVRDLAILANTNPRRALAR